MEYDAKGFPIGVVTRPSMVLDNSTGRLVDLGGQQGSGPGIQPPPDAITFLREKGAKDPAVVQMFDAKYGKGAAARYLNQGGGAQAGISPYPNGQRLTGKDGKIYIVKNGEPVLETE